jgi:hypothetical protein
MHIAIKRIEQKARLLGDMLLTYAATYEYLYRQRLAVSIIDASRSARRASERASERAA